MARLRRLTFRTLLFIAIAFPLGLGYFVRVGARAALGVCLPITLAGLSVSRVLLSEQGWWRYSAATVTPTISNRAPPAALSVILIVQP